jgi:hypothetical protein
MIDGMVQKSRNMIRQSYASGTRNVLSARQHPLPAQAADQYLRQRMISPQKWRCIDDLALEDGRKNLRTIVKEAQET